jgi:D-sedoheptulose 7-phosphate isomerase
MERGESADTYSFLGAQGVKKKMTVEETEDRIRAELQASAVLTGLVVSGDVNTIACAAGLVAEAFARDSRLLLCGNGGSAADCQHVAAEFVSRFSSMTRRALPALALTTDTSFLTAFANDVEFGGVFERQIEAHGREGDVLFAISTSGNSANVLRAVRCAATRHMTTIGLSGEAGTLQTLVDCAIVVPSRNTQHIQETMLAIEHVICDPK